MTSKRTESNKNQNKITININSSEGRKKKRKSKKRKSKRKSSSSSGVTSVYTNAPYDPRAKTRRTGGSSSNSGPPISSGSTPMVSDVNKSTYSLVPYSSGTTTQPETTQQTSTQSASTSNPLLLTSGSITQPTTTQTVTNNPLLITSSAPPTTPQVTSNPLLGYTTPKKSSTKANKITNTPVKLNKYTIPKNLHKGKVSELPDEGTLEYYQKMSINDIKKEAKKNGATSAEIKQINKNNKNDVALLLFNKLHKKENKQVNYNDFEDANIKGVAKQEFKDTKFEPIEEQVVQQVAEKPKKGRKKKETQHEKAENQDPIITPVKAQIAEGDISNIIIKPKRGKSKKEPSPRIKELMENFESNQQNNDNEHLVNIFNSVQDDLKNMPNVHIFKDPNVEETNYDSFQSA